MISFTLLAFLFISVSSLLWAKEKDPCLQLLEPVKEASQRFIGKDYPYWYNLATAKKETNCRWRTSLDGHGSVGYFQLTPKFLDTYHRPLFPDYDKPYSKDHFYAFAYYLNTLIKSSPIPKLWINYQRYNSGDWVLKECKLAGKYEHQACMKACYECKKLGGKRCRGFVCVWKTPSGKCKQYKHACEINYSYSVFIYQAGQRYKEGGDRYEYW